MTEAKKDALKFSTDSLPLYAAYLTAHEKLALATIGLASGTGVDIHQRNMDQAEQGIRSLGGRLMQSLATSNPGMERQNLRDALDTKVAADLQLKRMGKPR